MTETTSTPETDTFVVPAPIGAGDVMPTQSFADIAAADRTILAPEMLDSDAKERLAAASHEFTLLAIQQGVDDSGAYWSHLVDLGGRLATFRLQCHGARDRTAVALIGRLEDGPIGGVVLRSLSEKLGNQFLVLYPANER